MEDIKSVGQLAGTAQVHVEPGVTGRASTRAVAVLEPVLQVIKVGVLQRIARINALGRVVPGQAGCEVGASGGVTQAATAVRQQAQRRLPA